MNIINRYFTKQLIAIFIVLLLILAGLSWMIQIISMMKFVMNYGVEFHNFLGLTVLMVPFIVSIIIPFVCFIAVIYVYNKLISDNEVTVMMASSLSPQQLARPALVLAGILTILHLLLNIWIVPATQAQFYNTQWNLRYGLAHMKLQESAFTEMTQGLVVYVDNVSGHDLSQVMLSDTRKNDSQMVIFAEKGKLVSTVRGLSIVMTNGSLQMTGNTTSTIGTFDSFDMDLNVSERNTGSSFKVRRIPTQDLIKTAFNVDTHKHQKMVLNELATRFLTPLMNLILTVLSACILLRSSLLRRRTSFAPAFAVVCMAVTMSLFMTASNMLTCFTDLMLLGLAQLLVFIIILGVLSRK